MTRFIHDQFAKQYLAELLAFFGQVELSKDIISEVRQIDFLLIVRKTPSLVGGDVSAVKLGGSTPPSLTHIPRCFWVAIYCLILFDCLL
jgi:hypothetical protein